jgi:hypothetical protein
MTDSGSVSTDALQKKAADVVSVDHLSAASKKNPERSRTEDIAADSAIDFASLQLSNEILLGIS